MLSRNLSKARAAAKDGDIELSIQAHRPPRETIETDRDDENLQTGTFEVAKEKHQKGGEFVKSMVFGGLDGVVTTFAVVASVAGARLEYAVVLIMGFSNLLADGLSMGLGDYLSSKAEFEYIRSEKAREAWEYDNYLEGERREMVEIFSNKGIERADAVQMIQIFSKYKELFLDLMMVSELGLLPPPEKDESAKDGIVTFFSFLIFGSIPLFSYIFSLISVSPQKEAGFDTAFIIAIVLTALSLFVLGSVKAKFTGQNWWKSGGVMLLNGGLAAAMAYLVGFTLSKIIDSGK